MPTRVLGAARTPAAFPSLEACGLFGGQRDTGPSDGERVCSPGKRAPAWVPKRTRAPEAPRLALPQTVLREAAVDTVVVESSAARRHAAILHRFTTPLLQTTRLPSTRWRPCHSPPLSTWRGRTPIGVRSPLPPRYRLSHRLSPPPSPYMASPRAANYITQDTPRPTFPGSEDGAWSRESRGGAGRSGAGRGADGARGGAGPPCAGNETARAALPGRDRWPGPHGGRGGGGGRARGVGS